MARASEPHPGLRRAVRHREEPRQQTDVMAVHLVCDLRVGADDHQAESRLVLAQRRLDLAHAQRGVAARHARDRPSQARALDGRESAGRSSG